MTGVQTCALPISGGLLHTISVVDLVSQKSLPPIDLGIFHSAHGLVFAGGELYFTAEASKIIGRYDVKARQIDWILGTGQNRSHMLELSKDLSTIYLANVASGTMAIIDKTDDLHVGPPPGSPGAAPVPGFTPPPQPANPPPKPAPGWNVTIIPTGGGVEGFDVSPDGRELWAANADDGTVSIIDIASKKVIATLTFPGTVLANRLRFTPDGKTVLISYLRSGELIAIDAASRKLIKQLKVDSGAAGDSDMVTTRDPHGPDERGTVVGASEPRPSPTPADDPRPSILEIGRAHV